MGDYLSTPETKKDTSSDTCDFLKYCESSMQGWRVSMEDAHITSMNLAGDPKSALFAVFDGHGGSEVAKFCARHFEDRLLGCVHWQHKNYENALKYTFLLMDELLASKDAIKELHILKNKDPTNPPVVESNAGCTANVLLIIGGNFYIANAGDSRCYVKNQLQILALSEDHKPDCPEELRRILKAGGTVTNGRVMGHLNLSRAIGDLEHKNNENLKPSEQMVTAMPEVVTRKIGAGDKYLILGCDGVWELQNPTEIFGHIDKCGGNLEQAAEKILDCGLADIVGGQGCDNMSVIIVEMKGA